jgi:3'-phosphoadenosine 5'-phosphosulfate (PAPS) 3'-phosphatase
VLVRGYHGNKLQVETKAGDEPVSEADHAASALIVARLREAFPDDVVLSEELPDTGERLGSRGCGWSIRSTARAISSGANPGSW